MMGPQQPLLAPNSRRSSSSSISSNRGEAEGGGREGQQQQQPVANLLTPSLTQQASLPLPWTRVMQQLVPCAGWVGPHQAAVDWPRGCHSHQASEDQPHGSVPHPSAPCMACRLCSQQQHDSRWWGCFAPTTSDRRGAVTAVLILQCTVAWEDGAASRASTDHLHMCRDLHLGLRMLLQIR